MGVGKRHIGSLALSRAWQSREQGPREAEAWLELGSRELNDCREFRRRICEKKWHFNEPVNLQRTWEPLMLLMMTFLGRPVDKNKDSLRNYQRDRSGNLDEKAGETCVIELSELAAPSLEESMETGEFLQERIGIICDRIRAHQPKLVVMYGRLPRESWNAIGRAIAGREFPPDGSAPGKLPKTNILSHPPTILVCTPAASRPIQDGTRYLGDEYWTRLGRQLRVGGSPGIRRA
jgi:hypothetical protein